VKPNLLIIELRMMGDAIMSLPFIRAAKDTYKVFVCCQPSVKDVFRSLLPEDQIILWRPPWLDEEKKYSFLKWKNAGVKSLLQRLRKTHAQIAVSVWADARIHFLMALSGARDRIGFPMNRQNVYASELIWRRHQILIGKYLNFFGSLCLCRKLVNKKINRNDYFQHHIEAWRQLAKALGLQWSTEFPWFSTSSVLLPEKISEWLRAARIHQQKIWLLHPGARNANRRWPVEQFRALIEQTFLPSQIPLIVIDPVELSLPHEWPAGIFVYRPNGLAEFFGIVSAVDYVICNDTGVSHLAAALGKRVVCIFGANLPQWFAPYHNLDLVVQKDVCPLRPCLDRCTMPSYVCLEAVNVEMVQRQVEKLFTPNIRKVSEE
jgi:ADP-heptose:LPS heptosyltransferase